MESLSTLLESLNSFRNLYNAVLRCVRSDTKNARLLSPIISLTLNSTRHRIRNPQLWQLCEIEKLATYYGLPTSACKKLQEAFPLLWSFLDQLSDAQRKEVERKCCLKFRGVDRRLNANSSGTEIELIHQGLNYWLVGGHVRITIEKLQAIDFSPAI